MLTVSGSIDSLRSGSNTKLLDGLLSSDWLPSKDELAVLSRSDIIQDSFLTADDLFFFFLTEANNQLGPSMGSIPTICSKKDSVKDADVLATLGDVGLATVDVVGLEKSSLGSPTGVLSTSRTYGENDGNASEELD